MTYNWSDTFLFTFLKKTVIVCIYIHFFTVVSIHIKNALNAEFRNEFKNENIVKPKNVSQHRHKQIPRIAHTEHDIYQILFGLPINCFEIIQNQYSVN